MITYGFQREFGPQLASGDKTCTLRRPRKHPARHADVSEPVGLWTGMRTKEAKRRGVGLCTVRGLLRFEERGIRLFSDLRIADNLDIASEALVNEAASADGDAFARRDGFENWASAWSWHTLHRDDEERHAFTLVRCLVGWLPLNAEQIAAIDSGQARLGEVA